MPYIFSPLVVYKLFSVVWSFELCFSSVGGSVAAGSSFGPIFFFGTAELPSVLGALRLRVKQSILYICIWARFKDSRWFVY